MGLVTPRTVLVLSNDLIPPTIAQMGSHSVALVEDFYRSRGGADLHNLLHQSVGHAVNGLVSSSSSPNPSGNGQPIPAAAARSRYSWTVPNPIPQLRAIWRCPSPNSNRNRRTSLTFRMDFLLAGTLFSFA
jgi:hypothetical protein